jgi:hypothetical protein
MCCHHQRPWEADAFYLLSITCRRGRTINFNIRNNIKTIFLKIY